MIPRALVGLALIVSFGLLLLGGFVWVWALIDSF